MRIYREKKNLWYIRTHKTLQANRRVFASPSGSFVRAAEENNDLEGDSPTVHLVHPIRALVLTFGEILMAFCFFFVFFFLLVVCTVLFCVGFFVQGIHVQGWFLHLRQLSHHQPQRMAPVLHHPSARPAPKGGFLRGGGEYVKDTGGHYVRRRTFE